MSVKNYRLYFLTPHNDIYRFIELESGSDDEGAKHAETLLQHDAVEVWHFGWRICRLEPRITEHAPARA